MSVAFPLDQITGNFQQLLDPNKITLLNIGYYKLTVAGSNITITRPDCLNGIIHVSGSVTGTPILTMDLDANAGTMFFLINDADGADYSIKLRTGASVFMSKNTHAICYCNGTDLLAIKIRLPV